MLASVLIPTHNHGRLLHFALRSVLSQTEEDFEVFIIGDGLTEGAREAVNQVLEWDSRIRFFDYPKSPRTGEPHRHDVLLRHATGQIVCYLSDDDLWFPEHLETMAAVLGTRDVAHAKAFFVHPDGTFHGSFADWAVPGWRQWHLLQGQNAVPLSSVGHTMSCYRSLPHGWRTTEPGWNTDHYMWVQMVGIESISAACTGRATVACFPSPLRRDFSLEQRTQELQAWMRAVTETGAELQCRHHAWMSERWMACDTGLHELRQTHAALASQFEEARRSWSEKAGVFKSKVETAREKLKAARSRADMERVRLAALPQWLRMLCRWRWRRKGL